MKYYLEIREDGSEVFDYSYRDYSAQISFGRLSNFANHASGNHWHEDLEFVIAQRGEMYYNVNGQIIHLSEGEGIFVNSRQFHYGFSKESAECEYLCILLHPMLLCAAPLLESMYVSPFTSPRSAPYLHLSRSVSWQGAILSYLSDISEHSEDPLLPLRIQSNFSQIWLQLMEHIFQEDKAEPENQKMTTLKKMVTYITQHYHEKITLEDIAKVGCLSKSGCLALFKRHIKVTPIDFLINYRLEVGTEKLIHTDHTVTEIAYLVGFSSTSYFSECFRERLGCSPQQYRKRQRSEVKT